MQAKGTKALFAVIAQFEIKPGMREAFLAIAREDARHSVADEPGCLQFDICTSDEEPDLVTFYEVYMSRAAFDAHLETPHLARFKQKFPPLINVERPVHFLFCEHTHREALDATG
ncbi:MAG: putative quinol monooxygenase [Hoeflea sp.]|uniref:putative quinol monooxygenase n=1 Tax=Hoeflea sp. TaxID=1940281 RepID=UPI003298A075